jgi:hypothetical protein
MNIRSLYKEKRGMAIWSLNRVHHRCGFGFGCWLACGWRSAGHVVVDILERDCVVSCEGCNGEDPDRSKPVEKDEVDDALDDSHDDIEDTDDESGQKVDLDTFVHSIHDCEVDEDVGGAPYDRPDPVTNSSSSKEGSQEIYNPEDDEHDAGVLDPRGHVQAHAVLLQPWHLGDHVGDGHPGRAREVSE